MKVAVLGAGLMGTAAAYDLNRAPGVERVLVADRDITKAQGVVARFARERGDAHALDIVDSQALLKLLKSCDAAIGAISYRFNEAIGRACIATRTHFCDLGGNNSVVQAQFALSEEARQAGVALIPDTGLAPGMVGILLMRLLQQMPSAHTAHIRVGGLPLHPTAPFSYQIVFSVEGLINEYKEPTIVLRDGKILVVPTLGDVEELDFPAPFGRLEAFNTSGGASTLPYTLKDRLRNLDYKTIRYPGHGALVTALFALGLADEAPIFIDGAPVVPRRVLEHQMSKHLTGNGPDVVLLRVTVEGPDGRRSLRIIDQKDETTGLSAMARCTAFPAAIIAHMLASNEITDRGTLHQEFSVPAGFFVDRLIKRGISVVEEA